MASNADLRARLAAVLPRGRSLTVHHLSTPPTKTDALYSAPPGERPDRTYCENHFLAVSIPVPGPDTSSSLSSSAEKEEAATTTTTATTTTASDNNNNGNSGSEKGKRQVLILGVEIFIYTTAKSTTIFVAKADSTGYLSLLDLPRGAPSPIREVTAAFISFLVDARQRPRVPLVLSLFARSQSQYLFPGSVENAGKHVLDDRGLVKWWCRVLNPMLRASGRRSRRAARAYITIPGLDEYETRSFFPPSADDASRQQQQQQQKSWAVGIPLDRLSHYAREFDWVPPRCLIPRFPDDPKSRFRDELDEEARGSGAFKTTGSWKSVRNLDTFWEMMAYRQECSSGRMTGFIWVVFDDESASAISENPPPTTSAANVSSSSTSKKGDEKDQQPQTPQTQRTVVIRTPSTTPRKLFPASKKDDASAADNEPSSSLNAKLAAAKKKQKQSRARRRRKRLSGPIVPRAARVKTEQRNYLVEKTPAQTKYYAWPPEGRGGRVVPDKDYRRMVELLLHLDFATLGKAAGSTARWVSEVGLGRGSWGYDVEGEMELPVAAAVGEKEGQGKEGGVNNLGGLVKRKRTDSAPEVKTLGTGLIRKKPRPEEGDEEEGKKTEEK